MVETLDQDLELDGDDDNKASGEKKKDESGKITSVGLKKTILDANKKNAEGDDEVNLEDPAEDVQDAEEGKKPN